MIKQQVLSRATRTHSSGLGETFDFEGRIRSRFASQPLMTMIGASITNVMPGAVDISLVPSRSFRKSTASWTRMPSA